MAKRKIHASGYSEAGASQKKRSLRAFNPVSGSPAEDIDLNNTTLRQRGRILYMAAPIATGAINTNRTKVVGSGLRMKPAINREVLRMSPEAAQAWQQNTEAEWRMWCEKKCCDALEINNFYELQQIAIKSWLMSGDVFALIKRYEPDARNPYTLRLHLIEADRISTPSKYASTGLMPEGVNVDYGDNKIHDGVEVDAAGRVVAYHICNDYPNRFLPADIKWTRVPAKGDETGLPNILHIMDAERPDQYRGVSILAPVIEMLLQLRRYTESELMAALIQSYFTAWITVDGGASEMPINETIIDEEQRSKKEEEYEMGPGQVQVLDVGESVTFGSPNIPTAGFEVFEKTIIKQIGAALELPYDVLVKEFNSSYSAAKGALEEAWEAFKMRRSWFVNDFNQPIYELWLSEAVAIGRIKAPGFFVDPKVRDAWCGARWDGPAQTHLDPVKEANAAAIEVQHGWKTNEQVTRELYGGSWHDNAEARKDEQAIMPDPETPTEQNREEEENE